MRSIKSCAVGAAPADSHWPATLSRGGVRNFFHLAGLVAVVLIRPNPVGILGHVVIAYGPGFECSSGLQLR